MGGEEQRGALAEMSDEALAKHTGTDLGEDTVDTLWRSAVSGPIGGPGVPASPAEYDYGNVQLSAEDRSIADTFAPVAHATGWTHDEFAWAVRWAVNQGVVEDELAMAQAFEAAARERGISEGKMIAAAKWYVEQTGGPAALGEDTKRRHARLREIADFRRKDRAAYFRDLEMQAEERRLLEGG